MAVATSLQLMQQLEKEVVPACLRLYFNPDDHGARSHLKALRTLWTREVEEVESGVLGIVDATAFCYVANEEARAAAGVIKREQYSQVTQKECNGEIDAISRIRSVHQLRNHSSLVF